MELPYDSAIPLLDIFPEEMKTSSQKDFWTPIFKATLFTIAKMWKNLWWMNGSRKCDTTHIHTHKYTMEYYSPEQNSDVGDNVHELGRHYAGEISKTLNVK